jgi:hypothetical protein
VFLKDFLISESATWLICSISRISFFAGVKLSQSAIQYISIVLYEDYIYIMLHLRDLDIDHVKIKKPYIEDRTIFRLFYREAPLYLQTSCHLLKFKPSFDVYDYCSITLCDNPRHAYWKILEDMEFRVIERIRKKYNDMYEGKTHIPLINADKRLLRLRNKKNDVKIYDRNGRAIGITSLFPYDKVKVIMRIDHVWVSKFTFGTCAYLIQVLNIDAISENFDKPLLKVEDEDTIDSTMSTEAFERFSKMLKVGIPVNAVRQKMMLEGFDEVEMSRFLSRIPVALPKTIPAPPTGPPPPPPPRPPPPPPPPRPPPPPIASNPMAGVLSAIKGGLFKLKKMETPKQQKISLKGVDTSQRVPSLEEILSAKGKLKKPTTLNYLMD